MSGDSKIDDVKGRAKEAVGSLIDNDEMKREGRKDQRAADVKDGIESLSDKAKDAVDSVKDKTH